MAINNGYIRIYMPWHNSADSNGLVYEHQVVAERKIGRPLKDGEVVHHIDKNRANNAPENLLVFASHSDHAAFHCGACYVIDYEGIAHCEPIHNHKFCKICGKQVYWKSDICDECSHFMSRKVKNRPNRDELKKLIRENSFLKIGKMYNISDNAIRKWCKAENLPYKSSAIKQISDNDWLNI